MILCKAIERLVGIFSCLPGAIGINLQYSATNSREDDHEDSGNCKCSEDALG